MSEQQQDEHVFNAERFCMTWNAHANKPSVIDKGSCPYLILINGIDNRIFNSGRASRRQYERPNLLQLYTRMTPVWRALWNALNKFEPKQRFNKFLGIRAEIDAIRDNIVCAIRTQAWCWYHTKTPGWQTTHLEPKLLTDGQNRSLHRSFTKTLIDSELLTNFDLKDIPRGTQASDFIDELSSEQEWRRGLHSERSLLKLTASPLTRGIN